MDPLVQRIFIEIEVGIRKAGILIVRILGILQIIHRLGLIISGRRKYYLDQKIAAPKKQGPDHCSQQEHIPGRQLLHQEPFQIERFPQIRIFSLINHSYSPLEDSSHCSLFVSLRLLRLQRRHLFGLYAFRAVRPEQYLNGQQHQF